MSRQRRVVLSVVAAVAVALSAGTLAAAGAIPFGGSAAPPSAVDQAAAVPKGGDPAEAAAGNPAGRGGVPAPAGASPESRATAAPTPFSVAYLRERYGVSASEAQRRLALQQSSVVLAERLAQDLPDEYAGMWLDQAAGGVLRVGLTRPEKLTAALTGVDAAHVRAVPAAYSLRQLKETADRLAGELAGRPGVAVVVDQPGNRVAVVAEASADDAAIRAAMSRVGGSVRADRRTAPAMVPKSCDPLHCAVGPLRSGIRLDVPRDNGSVGGCTTGYSLRSRKTGQFFVLTAGHCVLSATHTRLDDTWHEFLTSKTKVTIEHPDPALRALLGENVSGLAAEDYAIMPYQDAEATAFWTDRALTGRGAQRLPGWINRWCPGGCASSPDLAITGVTPMAQVQVGWVVCAAGAAYTPQPGEQVVDSGAGAGYQPGIHCGEVTEKAALITVRICARPGDSGGPLFTEADGRALGILKNGDSRSGACVPGDPEINRYVPVQTVLDRVNSRTGLDLEVVRTAPSGSRPR